jgi:probable HAF family extracellular repeat protein
MKLDLFGEVLKTPIWEGCLALAVLALSAGDLWAQDYSITDLGSIGGTEAEAFAVNGSGEVAGEAYTPNYGNGVYWHAFFYRAGQMDDLGTLGGRESEAYGINDSGQVVGCSWLANNKTHAFLYSGGSLQDLGVLPGGSSSAASGINDSGEIVGTADDGGVNHAFIYAVGHMQALQTWGGNGSQGNAINNLGQVVGSAVYSGANHAFLYSGGELLDLGPGEANGLNNLGQVVGTDGSHAFLYSAGTKVDLGTFGGEYSMALGINDNGQAVGWAWDSQAEERAFVTRGNQIVDLNTLIDPASGWSLYEATGINNDGQIVGYGFDNGDWQAFLLNPIPEPPAMALLLLGSGGVLLRGRVQTKSGSRRADG